ncbi:MAG: ChaB family protein [Xanthobacteraceae bacterium]
MVSSLFVSIAGKVRRFFHELSSFMPESRLASSSQLTRRFVAHAGESGQEEAAHRIAWAAVKRSHVKVGGSWVVRHS